MDCPKCQSDNSELYSRKFFDRVFQWYFKCYDCGFRQSLGVTHSVDDRPELPDEDREVAV